MSNGELAELNDRYVIEGVSQISHSFAGSTSVHILGERLRI